MTDTPTHDPDDLAALERVREAIAAVNAHMGALALALMALDERGWHTTIRRGEWLYSGASEAGINAFVLDSVERVRRERLA